MGWLIEAKHLILLALHSLVQSVSIQIEIKFVAITIELLYTLNFSCVKVFQVFSSVIHLLFPFCLNFQCFTFF